MKISEIIRNILPLKDDDKFCLDFLKDEEEYEEIKYLLKQKRVNFKLFKFNVSLTEDGDYFELHSSDDSLRQLLDKVNIKLLQKGLEEFFKRFSDEAYSIIPALIAKNIEGLDAVKKAVALQLFMQENFHILMINDPSITGNFFIDSVSRICPNISSYDGLEVSDDSAITSANEGILAINRFNLLKRNERENLISAMEHGVIYTNESKREARIRLLAACLPIGGKFKRTFESIRTQLPVDLPILQKFHLLFFNKEADVATKSGAKKSNLNPSIRDADANFVRKYIDYALKMDVVLSRELQDEMASYVDSLKRRQYKYLVEITPKTILTVERLCKASARIDLRNKVEEKDLERVKSIINSSLDIV
ncbi:MAG TPA: hypothetical protein VJB94_05605 [Candidatus Nanoarchaeia archaeon]|nr:hypothetical protein [Candidatus Nanoarchaeia archaeon]